MGNNAQLVVRISGQLLELLEFKKVAESKDCNL